jgi:hypothetical protein
MSFQFAVWPAGAFVARVCVTGGVFITIPPTDGLMKTYKTFQVQHFSADDPKHFSQSHGASKQPWPASLRIALTPLLR